MKKTPNSSSTLNRRNFFQIGTSVLAGGFFAFAHGKPDSSPSSDTGDGPRIKDFRTLGRTLFQVSDISMGGTRNRESNVFRYAYDKGVNYFDTAEGYFNGESERNLGQALKYMDRKKVFITTKLHLRPDESEDSILERFRKCQERLQTDYIDALYMHGVNDVSLLQKAEFHGAVQKLKSENRLRFCGLSCHSSGTDEKSSMERILVTAAEDGRFDLMLLIYNFMNNKAGEQIIKACKKNRVGTTAMKVSPGVLGLDPFDPQNPTPEQERFLRSQQGRGRSREEAIDRLNRSIVEEQNEMKESRSFLDKYQIRSGSQLRKTSIQWALQNPDLHTVCVSFADFDLVDQIIPVSGTRLSRSNAEFLKNFASLFHNQYCRHGCNDCMSYCPHHLPVSTIMRYAYYYQMQSREKDAILKYSVLGENNASLCRDCPAPCISACPYRVNVPAQLTEAHRLLTLA